MPAGRPLCFLCRPLEKILPSLGPVSMLPPFLEALPVPEASLSLGVLIYGKKVRATDWPTTQGSWDMRRGRGLRSQTITWGVWAHVRACTHTHRSFLYHPHGAPTTSEGRTQAPGFHTRPGPAPQTGPAASSCPAAALVTGLLWGSEHHRWCLVPLRQTGPPGCVQPRPHPTGPLVCASGCKGKARGSWPSTHPPPTPGLHRASQRVSGLLLIYLPPTVS